MKDIDTSNLSKRESLGCRSHGPSTELTSEGISTSIPKCHEHQLAGEIKDEICYAEVYLQASLRIKDRPRTTSGVISCSATIVQEYL